MSAAINSSDATRTTRLTALVNAPEAERIAQQATAAGLSVSAYLRDRALGTSAPADDAEAALRQIDTLIDRMETDVDGAIAELSATLARMAAAA